MKDVNPELATGWQTQVSPLNGGLTDFGLTYYGLVMLYDILEHGHRWLR